ncbi:uncharacterized protein EAE98_000647 [Botrytis deweyae]|uniref:Uncharacterized protein n=1 Tax=Botrytis deweyae TaxID=2478750 RepID=A0ABQ7J3C6_9HELO|nr:uncharacterized protein EAE98_000647 [Botrytis deweyae]KAF7940520.1 hypothetical protein EAE98_000647 [Botrytis deweyae]
MPSMETFNFDRYASVYFAWAKPKAPKQHPATWHHPYSPCFDYPNVAGNLCGSSILPVGFRPLWLFGGMKTELAGWLSAEKITMPRPLDPFSQP